VAVKVAAVAAVVMAVGVLGMRSRRLRISSGS
jgi:hypothetical protein